MSEKNHAEDLSSAVHYALETTHAIAACPFHLNVVIRVGDDASETHAFLRAKNLRRSNGKPWKEDSLRREFKRQLGEAADRYCPYCAGSRDT
jgi:hypothetical protein